MDKATTDSLLVRLREAVLFYVKGNVLVLGGIVAVATALKLEKTEIISAAASNMWLLFTLGILFTFGLGLESAITTAVTSDDPHKNAKMISALRRAYSGYVLLQLLGLGVLLGSVAAYLDLFGAAK